MKAISRCLFALARVASFLLAMSLFAQQNKALPDKEPFHPTRIIVKFAGRSKVGAQVAALQQRRLRIQRQYQFLPQVAVLDLADANEAKAVRALVPADRAKHLQTHIDALRATGLFEYVEPDYVRRLSLEPMDAAYTNGTLWALHNFGQSGGTNGADIGASAAWDITTGSSNVIVAVIDTGIRYTHRDLAAQMWHNPGEVPGNGLDDDGDGYVDNVFGINAITGSGDPMDDNGHGSHVSGTIGAAANDGNPQVGVAWKVQLMACKFLDANGRGYTSDEIECLQFALAKGARIINASYGGYYFSQGEFEALQSLRDHGVLFVAAAGNNTWNNDSFLSEYPSSYQLHNILSVAAVDRFDGIADFSNYGSTTVHLGAPGVEIFSCWTGSDTNYNTIDGTSMATPHVVGAAALLLSHFPTATLTELRRRILDGVVPIPSLANKTVTGGRLNVFNALVAAPSGMLHVELSPRSGSPLTAGKPVSLYALISDLWPVTNATVTARITGFTNLTLLDSGSPPDAIPGDGVYTVAFLIPTNLSGLEVTLQVSAPGWPDSTNFSVYPVIFPPPNDDFTNRIVIPQSTCLATVTGSNLNASKEAGEPDHVGKPGGSSVWWSWTAPFTGSVKISTAGSSFDTLLAVYTGQSVSNLSPVAWNDDAGGFDLYSAVRFDAVAGTEYQIAVDGYAGSQGQIVLGVFPVISFVTLTEALDNAGLIWTSGGNAAWLGQSCVTYDGTNTARSGPIEAHGESWLETVIPVAGTLTFQWKVSSEGYADWLSFYTNGVAQARISGEVDWQQQVVSLGPGVTTLRWAYSKDRDVTAGQDAGWLDRVSFVPARSAIPTRFGDLDGDGQPTVLDLTLLIGYLRDTNSLLPQVAVFADVNGDGVINSNDIPALADAILGRTALRPVIDTDGDGIPDVLELLMGLDPTKKDSFGDGIADGDRDFDMDGLSNARELLAGTDPQRADTDGDGWLDEAELTAGSNPLDANSRPFMMSASAPPVALVLPADRGSGGLALNTTVASPPTALVLPASQGLTNNTVVAVPPVALVLSASQGLANNTVVAVPPAALVLLASQGPTNNAVIGMPPVRIRLPSP